MHPLGTTPRATASRAATLALVVALAAPVLGLAPAVADETDVPSRAEVRSARAATDQGERDVTSVRADLARVDLLVEQEARTAQQAAEAFNGARYAAQQARKEAQAAHVADLAAQEYVERVRLAYAELVRGSLTTNRDLEALSSIMAADGLTEMLDLTSSYRVVGSTLDARYDEVAAAQDEAAAASVEAETAQTQAVQAREDAELQRDRTKAASQRARAQAADLAARAQSLVAELARLEGVSVAVAQQRQDGLARRAAQRAEAQAAEAATQAATAQVADSQVADSQVDGSPDEPGPAVAVDPTPTPNPTPAEPAEPEPAPAPTTPSAPPSPSTSSSPAPASGAQAAVDFARAQLGERYVWAAAGPDAWDCSGLTMGAWAAGGKSLPHYSVAQYDASTPIAASERQPGDLVFWASSSDPSSIYHVALYVGDDRIIHAPRAGRPVSEDSLFYWIPPTFYTRP